MLPELVMMPYLDACFQTGFASADPWKYCRTVVKAQSTWRVVAEQCSMAAVMLARCPCCPKTSGLPLRAASLPCSLDRFVLLACVLLHDFPVSSLGILTARPRRISLLWPCELYLC